MNNLLTEDDDLFLQPTSSTLEGLFGPLSINKSENTDLAYVAPRQPKSVQKQKQVKSSIRNAVVFAKVVQVYKSVDDSYKIIGKYGLALISDTTKLIEILLYKDKQNILTRATLHNIQIHIENNDVNFIDNNNEKWYVQFDDEKILNQFLGELKQANIKFIEVPKEKLIGNVTDTGSIDNIDNASDNESEGSSISQTRADILSRMAKMGHSILPGNLKNESDEKDNYLSSKNIRRITADPKTTNNSIEVINHTLLNENRKNNILNKSPESPSITNNSVAQVFPYVPGYPQNTALINTMHPSQEFNLLASENRIQNTEVRINLTTISSKLDTVLAEISKIKEPPNTDKLENEFLKSKIMDLEKQINNLTERLAETNLNTSKMDLLIMKKNEEIEYEKQKSLELQSSLRHMEDLEARINNFAIKESELNKIISSLHQQLENSKKTINESDSKYAKLQEINETLMTDNENLSERIKHLAAKYDTNENISQEKLEREVKYLSNVIKDSMNFMYQNIMSQFNRTNEPLHQNQFKTILSANIKQATFNVIENFQSFLKATDNSLNSVNSKESI